jgi:hypothetical protein
VGVPHKHLFLGALKRVFAPLAGQAVAEVTLRRFLGKLWQARCAVPVVLPSNLDTQGLVF